MTVSSSLSADVADRYRIERELGSGGMATVYLAHDVKHDRPVALKVLRPDLAAVIGADRFLQEIRTTANLQHPHILPLHDSGEAGGTVFYVMPFVEGESVRERLEREKQLGVEDAVKIAEEVTAALDYAHRKGVIHRDIKPENILLHDGQALVADFGIALAVSRSEGGTRLTETGMSLGTPHYMSPEQAMGEREITPAADVYALGCVLYEMLTGEPPFDGPTAQAIVSRVLTSEPELVTSLRKTVPPHVAAAVHTALEKVPADRFPTAKAFAEALVNPAYVRRAGTAAPPARRSAATVALGSAAVFALALAAFGWLRPTPDQPTTREWVGLSPRRPGGALPVFWPSDLAIAKDGSAIVFGDSIDDSGTWQLLLKEQGSTSAVPIPGAVGGLNPFFSPDGEWVGFATADGLYRIPRNGGAPVKLSDSTSSLVYGVYSSGAWLDDGTIVFAGRDNMHLLQIDAEGGPEREVLAASEWIEQGIVRLEPLPGGRGVLITSCAAAPCTRGAVWLLDLRRDTVVQIIDGVSSGWYLPTGHVLYGRPDGTLFAQKLDVDRGELTGPAVPVMSGLATNQGIPAVALSPAGTLLYALRGDTPAAGFTSSLVWVARDGTTSTLDTALSLPGNEQGMLGLSLSPDGHRLALVQNTDRGPQIFVKQLPDGPLTRLTTEGWNARPEWSPDGRDLVHIMYRTGVPSVAVRTPADGTGALTVVAAEARPVQEVSLSPDGTWFLYRTSTNAPGSGDILGRRLTGDTTVVPLIATPAAEAAPTISPDGRWLAYTSDEDGRREVFVRPWPDVNGGKWRVSREGGAEPRWSPNGSELYYRSGRQDLMAAQVDATGAFHVRETRTVFSASAYLGDGFHTAYAVSPDGRRFLFGRPDFVPQSDASRLILARHWFTELRPLLRGN
jgi:WD40 repeat protein